MTDPAIQRTMVKNVKIHAPIAIKTVSPTIYGDIDKTTMSPATIMKCLIGRATVWEILSDGSLLKLNEHNYNTVNSPIPKVVEKEPKLVRDVDRSAIAKDEEEAGYKTMILKDNVIPRDEVDIAPGTVEDLNEKIKEAGEIPAPKKNENKKAEEEVPSDDEGDDLPAADEEMTDEEKELAELQAQIDELEKEEKNAK